MQWSQKNDSSISKSNAIFCGFRFSVVRFAIFQLCRFHFERPTHYVFIHKRRKLQPSNFKHLTICQIDASYHIAALFQQILWPQIKAYRLSSFDLIKAHLQIIIKYSYMILEDLVFFSFIDQDTSVFYNLVQLSLVCQQMVEIVINHQKIHLSILFVVGFSNKIRIRSKYRRK